MIQITNIVANILLAGIGMVFIGIGVFIVYMIGIVSIEGILKKIQSKIK